jgi:hypothetical protein
MSITCGTSLLVPSLFLALSQLYLLAPRPSTLIYLLVAMLRSLNVLAPSLSSHPPTPQLFVLLVPRGAPTGSVLLAY